MCHRRFKNETFYIMIYKWHFVKSQPEAFFKFYKHQTMKKFRDKFFRVYTLQLSTWKQSYSDILLTQFVNKGNTTHWKQRTYIIQC